MQRALSTLTLSFLMCSGCGAANDTGDTAASGSVAESDGNSAAAPSERDATGAAFDDEATGANAETMASNEPAASGASIQELPETPNEGSNGPGTTPVEGEEVGRFIAWQEFTSEQDTELPTGPLDIRSAAAHQGYDGGDLVMSINTGEANNRVLAFDLDELTYRELWFHLDCGDCRVGSNVSSILLATEGAAWQSFDGGYRFAQIGEWGAEEYGQSQQVLGLGSAAMILTESSWLTPSGERYLVDELDWPTYSTSISSSGALEYTARYATLHAEMPQSDVLPCLFPGSELRLGMSWNEGAAVVLSCAENAIAYSPDLGVQPFELLELAEPALWVGPEVDLQGALLAQDTTTALPSRGAFVATDTRWYQFDPTTSAVRQVGTQASGGDEAVFDHAVDAAWQRGLRISATGVTISQFPETHEAR